MYLLKADNSLTIPLEEPGTRIKSYVFESGNANATAGVINQVDGLQSTLYLANNASYLIDVNYVISGSESSLYQASGTLRRGVWVDNGGNASIVHSVAIGESSSAMGFNVTYSPKYKRSYIRLVSFFWATHITRCVVEVKLIEIVRNKENLV